MPEEAHYGLFRFFRLSREAASPLTRRQASAGRCSSGAVYLKNCTRKSPCKIRRFRRFGAVGEVFFGFFLFFIFFYVLIDSVIRFPVCGENDGEAVGEMDADETDGAMETRKDIKQHIEELKDDSEIICTAGSGMQAGAYHSSDGSRLFVKVNADAAKFYHIFDVDRYIASYEEEIG